MVQYFTISAEIRIADGGRTIPIEQLFFGHDVGPGMIYQDSNLKVTAIENTHFGFHKGAVAGPLRESKRASIGLVGCPHEGSELGIEARRILPERSMTDAVVQREPGAGNFCSRILRSDR